MSIRVAIADDHPIVLVGMQSLFAIEPDIEVVAACRNGEQTLEFTLRNQPDVLILDLRMPRLDGLSVLQEMRRVHSPTRVVLLSAVLLDAEIKTALRLGARGVVLKEQAPQQLVQCVRTVYRGGWWLEHTGFSPHDALTSGTRIVPLGSELTDREREIVTRVADGLRNKEIARELGIAEGTVKIHLNNIYRKLGVDSRVGLALHARRHG